MSQLSPYILAGYPLLWVETFEEYRAIATFVAEMTESKAEYHTYTWDEADGARQVEIQDGVLASGEPLMTKVEVMPGEYAEQPVIDPMVMLDWIDKEVSENSIIFLKDFHSLLNKAQEAPKYRRKIRNLISKFKSVGKTLVIVSPLVDIPKEIEKEISVIPFKLPTRKEIEIVLKGVVESASDGNQNLKMPKGNQLEALLDAATGMTSFEAENAFSVCLVETKGQFDPGIIRREKAAIVKKSGILEVIESKENLDDIGGLEIQKNWILNRINRFSEKARKFGLHPPKGMIIFGVPGTGKSLTAKALRAAMQRPLLKLSTDKIFTKYYGESQGNLRTALNLVEAVAPCVLWIDEFEKAFAGTKGGQDGGHEETKKVYGLLLNWMQDRTADVFIIATGNDLELVDSAVLRRFDVAFWVDLPDAVQREEIIKIHLKKVKRGIAVLGDKVSEVVKACDGFTGAEIENWVQAALGHAFNLNKDEVDADDFLKSTSEITPISVLMSDDLNRKRKEAMKRGMKNASLKHKEKVETKATNGKRKIQT